MTLNFSVIVPVYNREETIERCINSILSQAFPASEIIIVDDGSSDNTVERIRRAYGEKVILLTGPNRGPGSARNTGAQHSTGDYLCFLDSDDVWYPYTLDIFRQVIEAEKNVAFISGAGVECVGEHGSYQADESLQYEFYPSYIEPAVALGIWTGTPSVAIRRDVFVRVGGFDMSVRCAEDTALWLKLAAEPGYVYVKSPALFQYIRGHDSAVSDLDEVARGIDNLLSLEQAGRFSGGKRLQKARQRYLGKHVRPAVIALLRAGKFTAASRLFRRSIGIHLREARVRFIAYSTLRLILRF